MKENIKKVEDKNIKFQAIQMSQDIPKNNLFKKSNDPEKDKEHVKKKIIKFLSTKKQFFKVQKISEFHKKNPLIILILMMEDGKKMKKISLFTELLYMELIGKKLKI